MTFINQHSTFRDYRDLSDLTLLERLERCYQTSERVDGRQIMKI